MYKMHFIQFKPNHITHATCSKRAYKAKLHMIFYLIDVVFSMQNYNRT